MSTKTLTPERSDAIARLVLIQKMADDGRLMNAEELKRELPNYAKKVGVSESELLAFMHDILPQIIGKRLGCNQVSLVWEEK